MQVFKNIKCHLFLVILFFSLIGVSVNSQAAGFPEAGDFSEGSKVWAQNCNRCHNMRGPKELRDDQWISTSFHMRMRAGLTGQETRDVITFLQASNTQSVVSGPPRVVAVSASEQPETGKDIYEKTCTACHGVNGKGTLPGAPDFTLTSGVLLKTDKELIANIINGYQSEGSPMAMPPKGGNPNLSNHSVSSVLKYIRNNFSK